MYDRSLPTGARVLSVADLVVNNLLSPMVLAFLLGAGAVFLRSDLSIPHQVYTALSTFLLLAIGLKGGIQLRGASLAVLALPIVATLAVGVLTPLATYGYARRIARFDVPDAAALAAHYGSVSAVTFAAALAYLAASGDSVEGFMPALVVVLEVPAIVLGILLARMHGVERGSFGEAMHEVVTGRSVLLLIGGLAIGYVAPDEQIDRVNPMFRDLFYGILVLFLLDMGTVAAQRLRESGGALPRLAILAVVLPLINGAIGIAAGRLCGLSVGGTTVLGVMAASASYIAAPAAVRVALPQANPGIYLTAAIGVTFPFNLAIGIPLLHELSRLAHRI